MFIHGMTLQSDYYRDQQLYIRAMIFIPLFLSLYFQWLLYSRLSAIVDGMDFISFCIVLRNTVC